MFEIPLPDRSGAAKFQVNPLIVRIALAELRHQGGDPSAICAQAGFSLNELEDPNARLSYLQASTALRCIREALREEHSLGLRIGLRHHLVASGLVGFAAMACTTLRDAGMLALRFQDLAGSMLVMDIDSHSDHVVVLATPRFSDVSITACLIDGTFAALVTAARQLISVGFRPRAVELVARQPADTSLHHQVFQCPVRFGCARNRLVIDHEWWLSRIDSGDPRALQRLVPLLEAATVQKTKNLSIDALIENRLRENIRQPPSLVELAKLFNTSERNLRRKLSEAGRSYGDILDQARKTRALELITHTQYSMQEIAEEIGFNDPRSLRRAFKRWTGKTLASAMANMAVKRAGAR